MKGNRKAQPRSKKRAVRRRPKIDSPALVSNLKTFIRRYVVMTDQQLTVVALWVIHTHCIWAFEQTPYLSVTSPEKQCGKSRLLEVLELLVREPWSAIGPSEAVMFRNIHFKTPTLLLDEVDTLFNPKTADRYEGHRAILNAGHRKGSRVPRCVGPKQEIQEFRVFCPKVLAGIGNLPETVADRAIPIRLKRRTRSEAVEKFKRREAKSDAEALRTRVVSWADHHAESFGAARPEIPDELSDRAQEGCECLVAIADATGVGKAARSALVELLTDERLDDRESMRLRLLRDLQCVFEARDAEHGYRVSSISTETLLKLLHAMAESPWASYYGRGLDARDLASLLSHYNIGPTTLRFKDGKSRKGYKRDDLHDVFDRYLS
jgi:Protein of unknown function (DUF3631)